MLLQKSFLVYLLFANKTVNLMKKLFALFLVGSFTLALLACGGGTSSSSEAEAEDATEEPAIEEAPMEEEAPADSAAMESDSAETM